MGGRFLAWLQIYSIAQKGIKETQNKPMETTIGCLTCFFNVIFFSVWFSLQNNLLFFLHTIKTHKGIAYIVIATTLIERFNKVEEKFVPL